MSVIILDFDGTLADSFPYVSDFLAEQAGVELTVEQRKNLRGLSMAGMARALGFSWLRLPLLFIVGRRRMLRAIHNLQPIAGMPAVIIKLNADGHKLFIVSTNSAHNVHRFLHHHQLRKYFAGVYGGAGVFGKASALRRLARQHKLEIGDCIYIGDELRDLQAAESINMPAIAVSWGFARTSDLEAENPGGVVHHPAELLTMIGKL